MRAWQTARFGAPHEALVLRDDVEPPEPAPGTVVLEVIAAGIGLPDVLMCDGRYPLTPSGLPFTQGQEVVGRVVGWGDGVAGRSIGDRVHAVTRFFTGDGAFAERCLALDDFCLPVPDGMTDAEAAGFLIPFHTAHAGLVERGRLRAGETLLVLGGAGGTGQAAIQVGKALGARVIATAGGADKAAFCLEIGADAVVDRRSEDVAAAVRAFTDDRGADVVYDPVGGDAYAAATRCIANAGRLLLIGFASGAWGRVDPAHLVTHNYSVVGVMPGAYDRAFKEAAQEELIAWWRAGKLRPRVDALVAFEDLAAALERLADGRVLGKLVLAVDPAATAPDGLSSSVSLREHT